MGLIAAGTRLLGLGLRLPEGGRLPGLGRLRSRVRSARLSRLRRGSGGRLRRRLSRLWDRASLGLSGLDRLGCRGRLPRGRPGLGRLRRLRGLGRLGRLRGLLRLVARRLVVLAHIEHPLFAKGAFALFFDKRAQIMECASPSCGDYMPKLLSISYRSTTVL